MAISYPLNLPTSIGVANITLTAANVVATSMSPFTYKQQVVRHTGQAWQADVKVPSVQKDLAEPWITFLMSLNGPTGTFLLGDPSGKNPRGSAATTTGTPVVNGADQTGAELDIDGLPTSTTGYLLAGDYIQLGGGATARLHKVLTDVNTDASGQATLDIWPEITSAPADNSTVVLFNTVGVFRLSTNSAQWSIDSANTYQIGFSALQAI